MTENCLFFFYYNCIFCLFLNHFHLFLCSVPSLQFSVLSFYVPDKKSLKWFSISSSSKLVFFKNSGAAGLLSRHIVRIGFTYIFKTDHLAVVYFHCTRSDFTLCVLHMLLSRVRCQHMHLKKPGRNTKKKKGLM